METKMTTEEAFKIVLDAAAMFADSGDEFFHGIDHKALIKAIDIVEDHKRDLVRN